MKRYSHIQLALAMLMASPLFASQPRYTIADLGVWTSWGGSAAYATNNAGATVGSASIPQGGWTHAVLFTANGIQDLGTLGGASSDAWGINNAGVVVGQARASIAAGADYYVPFYYDGSMHQMSSSSGLARGINSAGRIVGQIDLRGFVYDSKKHTIEVLNGFGSNTTASAINDPGQIVGYADLPRTVCCVIHAFMYDGLIHDLGTLGGDFSFAFAINNRGEIVGSSTLAQTTGAGVALTRFYTMAQLCMTWVHWAALRAMRTASIMLAKS